MKKGQYKWLFFFLFLLLFDIGIKVYTHFHIAKMSWLHPIYPYGGIAVFKNFFHINFSINHVRNLGAAWGVFSSYGKYLFYFRIFLVLALSTFLFFFNKEKSKVFPLLLIITGATGNILDGFFYGHVIDMFYFTFGRYSYPLFNLADCMIVIGIVWLFISSTFSLKKFKKKSF